MNHISFHVKIQISMYPKALNPISELKTSKRNLPGLKHQTGTYRKCTSGLRNIPKCTLWPPKPSFMTLTLKSTSPAHQKGYAAARHKPAPRRSLPVSYKHKLPPLKLWRSFSLSCRHRFKSFQTL